MTIGMYGEDVDFYSLKGIVENVFFSVLCGRVTTSLCKNLDLELCSGILMLKLKLQYFGHLMRRADSFEKTLMLGKIEGRRRRG